MLSHHARYAQEDMNAQEGQGHRFARKDIMPLMAVQLVQNARKDFIVRLMELLKE